MKITILSDIHGNYPALTAVLRHARARQAAGTILNLGDSIGYGPNPNEVVRWMQGEHIINILGNYDKKVLSKAHQNSNWESVNTPDKRTMFAWTCHALKKNSRKYLKTLPEQRELQIAGKRVLMTHGSPASNTEHLKPDTPNKRFEKLADRADTDIILCGHSHQAFVKGFRKALFINPGSVGRPDDGDPRASYAILEIHKGKATIRHFRVPYDIMATVHALRQTGLREIFTEIIRQGLNYDDVVKAFGEKPEIHLLEPCGIITLTTDFGLKDPFVGVMKGVIADIAPQAKVIDLSHHVQAQNIIQGSRVLADSVPFFTPGSVHIAVVDPGVGTRRRALAARIGSHFYVAPDNGLLTMVIRKAELEKLPVKIVNLTQPKFWLETPSRTFHGRDIFAPVGAHLANGLPLEKLGDLINDPVLLDLPQPKQTPSGWQAEIVYVDRFGNLSSNLPASLLPEGSDEISIAVKGQTIHGVIPAFGLKPPGTLIATVDSSGYLSIAVVNGSAAETLQAELGTLITIYIR